MNKFIKILRDYDNDDIIKDFLLDKELEFYNNVMIDVIISLGFYVPNYNILTSLLEIHDNVNPAETEMFANGPITNVINLYHTNISYLYLVRREQFGLRDEDAIITELVFSNNTKELINTFKIDLCNRNIVREFKQSLEVDRG